MVSATLFVAAAFVAKAYHSEMANLWLLGIVASVGAIWYAVSPYTGQGQGSP
jgi:hypothetical protein